jgi:hypothetical protein
MTSTGHISCYYMLNNTVSVLKTKERQSRAEALPQIVIVQLAE